MLLQLEIRNFAIIEHTIINFENHFNALTGETGAGKSILLDALSVVIGERTNKEWIRKGEEKATVKAVFLKTESLDKLLKENEIDTQEDVLIIERQISKNGRTIAKINGRIETIQTIKNISKSLLEICGQKEHLNLLDESNYLKLIDGLCGSEHETCVISYKEAFAEWKSVQKQLHELLYSQREQEQLLDLYRFQKKEIEDAQLKENEDDDLESEKQTLNSFEKVSKGLKSACLHLEQVNDIYAAKNELQSISSVYKEVDNYVDRLEKAYYEIEDIRGEIEGFLSTYEYDEERLDAIMYRLENISSLKRKYGDSIPEVLKYYEEVSEKVYSIDNKDEVIHKLEKRQKELETMMDDYCVKISKERQQTALDIQERMNVELKELCMENAKLAFHVEELEIYNEYGKNKVAIRFSANKGEELKPLAKVASGGELSRVLLAMKMVTSQKQGLQTIIFDEVDEGIGGEVGRVIGEKLASLGEQVQVITISHLPQVASTASAHYIIKKETKEERTVSTVQKLNEAERIQEIARMIYGNETNEITLKQAEEMLKKRRR